MAMRTRRHLPSAVLALGAIAGGIRGMQEHRRALFTGTAAAVMAWLTFLAVLWWSLSPR
jgi:hypothetical protein